jgi:hypothetical protein
VYIASYLAISPLDAAADRQNVLAFCASRDQSSMFTLKVRSRYCFFPASRYLYAPNARAPPTRRMA